MSEINTKKIIFVRNIKTITRTFFAFVPEIVDFCAKKSLKGYLTHIKVYFYLFLWFNIKNLLHLIKTIFTFLIKTSDLIVLVPHIRRWQFRRCHLHVINNQNHVIKKTNYIVCDQWMILISVIKLWFLIYITHHN